MSDAALQKRLDVVLTLLAANFVLLLGLTFHFSPETAVGVLALTALIGYGHFRGGT